RRRPILLRGDVDAAGASCRLLRRPRLWRRARRADAVADARLRDREQVDVRIHLRPHRRTAHTAARLEPAGLRVALVSPLQRARVALCRSEEHTSELQSRSDLVCRLLLEKKKHNNSGPLTYFYLYYPTSESLPQNQLRL